MHFVKILKSFTTWSQEAISEGTPEKSWGGASKIVMDNLGSSFHSDGSITYSNGTNISSEGATFFNNGTIKFSDGAVLHTDLQIIHADGTVVQGELLEKEDVLGEEEDEAGDEDDSVNGEEEAVVNAETNEGDLNTGNVEDEVETGDEGEDQDEEVDDISEDAGEGTYTEEEGMEDDLYDEEKEGIEDEGEEFDVVGTLDLDKISELWTAKQCEGVGSGSTNCTLLNYLKNSTLLMQLMEALTAEDAPEINTWSGIVQLMDAEGMTPDANSYVATIYAQDLVNQASNEGGQLSSGVHCDHRELRCRNGLACYAKTRHCDLKADCIDFSDEDSCSCRDRLSI